VKNDLRGGLRKARGAKRTRAERLEDQETHVHEYSQGTPKIPINFVRKAQSLAFLDEKDRDVRRKAVANMNYPHMVGKGTNFVIGREMLGTVTNITNQQDPKEKTGGAIGRKGKTKEDTILHVFRGTSAGQK